MQNKKRSYLTSRKIQFSEAINEALYQSMKKDRRVIIMGLGVDDPKRIFGTTKKLKEVFGSKRVFDMPTSENAMTGIALGASLSNFKPVLCHQRVEFALLSMDQIINQAAKWFYMNAGQMNAPIVIRLIVGRGWGQGPQHSQSLESLFANIPGLKVITPSTAYDAKGLLNSSIFDKNPVIFFEHRWLHSTYGKVPKKYYKIPIGKSKILKKGNDITIVSNSYMTVECLKAQKILNYYGVKTEIIDLRSLRPLDTKPIINSVKKTKKLIVVDNGWMNFGISSEILSVVSETIGNKFIIKTKRLGLLDTPIPSTRKLAELCYPHCIDISLAAGKLLNRNFIDIKKKFNKLLPTDVPNSEFRGPF